MDSGGFLDPKNRCLKNSAPVLEDTLRSEELEPTVFWNPADGGSETREDCGHFACFVTVQFVLNKSQD